MAQPSNEQVEDIEPIGVTLMPQGAPHHLHWNDRVAKENAQKYRTSFPSVASLPPAGDI